MGDPAVADTIIAFCRKHFPAHKSDCNQFLKAVAGEFNINFPVNANADAIVKLLEDGLAGWETVNDGIAAKAKAEDGCFVIAGLQSKDHAGNEDHGHVAVVIKGGLAHGKYPTAYWGSLGGAFPVNMPQGEPPGTLNWAWKTADRDKVKYWAKFDPEWSRIRGA